MANHGFPEKKTTHQVPTESSGQRVHPAGKLPQGATLVSAQTHRQRPNLATGELFARWKRGESMKIIYLKWVILQPTLNSEGKERVKT